MLTELLSIVLPVYLCAAVGFLWVRTGRPYDTAFMTDLVMLNTSEIDGDYSILLRDKLLFELLVAPHIRIPRTFAYVERQVIHWLTQPDGGGELRKRLRPLASQLWHVDWISSSGGSISG